MTNFRKAQKIHYTSTPSFDIQRAMKAEQQNISILELFQQAQSFIEIIQQALTAFQQKIISQKNKYMKSMKRKAEPEPVRFSLEMLKTQLQERSLRVGKQRTNKRNYEEKKENNEVTYRAPVVIIDPFIEFNESFDGCIPEGEEKIDEFGSCALPIGLDGVLEDEDLLFLDDSPPENDNIPHYPQHFFEQQLKRITKLDPDSTIKDVQKFATLRWKEMTPQQKSTWCEPNTSKRGQQKKQKRQYENHVNFDTFLANKLNKTKENISKEKQKGKGEKLFQDEPPKVSEKISIEVLVAQLNKDKLKKKLSEGQSASLLEQQKINKIFDS